MQNLNELRRLAGLPINEKQGHFEPLDPNEAPENDPNGTHHVIKGDEEPKDEPKGDDKAPKKDGKGKGEGEEEPAFPEVVTAMAKKIEGKTGDELVAIVAKLYDAGVKDGVAQAKAEMEGDGEKKKEKKDKGEEAPKDGEADVPPLPPEGEELPPEEPKKESLMIQNLRKMINY